MNQEHERGSAMNQEHAAALAAQQREAHAVKNAAKQKRAASVNLLLDPAGDRFEIRDGRGRKLFACDSTKELADWFKEYYMEDVL